MEKLFQSLPSWVKQSESDFDPLTLAKMKADTVNAVAGDLTGFDCQKCRNRGNFAIPKDNGNIAFQDCDCMKIRRCIWKMERSGLKDVIREFRFERYQTSATWQEKARELAERYAQNPAGWFLACGQSGSGKTHLCTAICRELLMGGNQVVYMPWRQDVAELKAASLDSGRRSERLNELKNAEYLYIDDLFKMGANPEGIIKPTSSDVSIAFEIINHRYINHSPTIISTELLPEELLRVDEATGGRIVERANGYTLAIGKDVGKNYRLRGVVVL